MTSETRNFLNIIKSAISAKGMAVSLELPDNSFWELTNKHNIATMIYYGLHYSGASIDENIKNIFRHNSFIDTMIDENQHRWYDIVSSRLEAANIKYIPLKGINLKELYPKREIRRMGDIDILIDASRKNDIDIIMEELGFKKGVESDHELVWSNNEVCIELHTRLIPSYNKDFYAYFGDGWDRAVPACGSKYSFSAEDTFIYMFTHFAKHYRDSGIGIIHMCDLWLYINNNELDFRYIDEELGKLYLKSFWYNVRSTLDAWFGDRESDEMTDYITEVIFASGAYGLHENSVASAALKKKNHQGENYSKSKALSLLRLVFPSFGRMKELYPVLCPAPYLLPLFWIVRLSAVIFGKRSKITSLADDIRASSDKNVSDYHSALKYVGLDYNFK